MEERGLLESDVVLVFHAGKAYTDPLRSKVEFWVDAVRNPTEGLLIGERMAWYNEH